MRFRNLTLMLILCFCGRGLVPSVSAQDTPPSLYRDAIRRLVDEVYNEGRIGAVDELFAATYTRHPDATDRDGFKRNILALRAAMPDLEAQSLLLIVEENSAALHLSIRGTFVADMVFPDSVPIPATNQPIALIVSSVFVFNEQGQIDIEWTAFDNLSFLAAIGLLEPVASWNAPDEAFTPAASSATIQASEMIARYYQAMNAGDFGFIQEQLLDGFVSYNPFGDFDREGYVGDWWSLREALSGFTIAVEMTVAEGDWVAAACTLQGTFDRVFRLADGSSVPPTGGRIELTLVTFHQFDEQGRLRQIRELYDGYSLLAQIKLVPDQPPVNPQ
ncbi:MAG: ester cyclase [Chloroflexi bacterium]|nr:ester cyclase [Chloroflexota bacterium]